MANGRLEVAAAGTAEPLDAAKAIRGMIVVQALESNTSPVAVGTVGVIAADGTETGVRLNPGEVISFPPAGPGVSRYSTQTIYVDVQQNGEGVSWTVYE